ncbi:major facilitator superfamily transporter [Botrytis cinerea]
MSVSRYLPFASRTTDAQAVTYLLAVCLFSISFLVFLNSSVSFVITDLIGVKEGVGDLVGTLGFADEVVALLACPAWGILSDRLGVRVVCVLGYLIVGLALILFVQAKNVFPQLLLARLFFSVGGAATATMVTAILPSMSARETDDSEGSPISRSALPENVRHSIATESIDSEITITPTNYNDRRCGALVALIAFLPLPAQFSRMKGVSQGQAVADSFYVVGVVSLMVSCFCFIGLRGLAGEEGKGWRLLLGRPIARDTVGRPGDEQTRKNAQIGLGYLGGFVARASSVGISLFIPLYINSYFIGHGFCQGSPNDPSPELKKECRRAYVLAAELTGASQLIALLCAPLFGYLSDRYRRFNVPLLTASVFGVIGYIGFAQLVSPEPQDINGRGGSPIVFVMVALIGISQIGAIVCSLGLLGRGVLGDEGGYNLSSQLQDARSDENTDSRDTTTETASLIAPLPLPKIPSRNHLKGSIAGVYSLSGGAAILLLTKLGGYLFDNLSTGAPFYMMAIFNAILLVIGIGAGVYREVRTAQKHR